MIADNSFPHRRNSGTLEKFYGAILPIAGRVVFYSYGSGDVLVGHLAFGDRYSSVTSPFVAFAPG